MKHAFAILLFLYAGVSAAAGTDVCKRSAAVRAYLEKFFRMPCAQITPAELVGFGGPITIDVRNKEFAQFQENDFQGFRTLKNLTINAYNAATLSLPNDVFNGLNLDELTLNASCISAATGAFNGLTSASIELRQDPNTCDSFRDEEIKPGAFNSVTTSIIFVDFGGSETGNRLFERLVTEYPNLYFSKQK